MPAQIRDLEHLTSTIGLPCFVWEYAGDDLTCVGRSAVAAACFPELAAKLQGRRASELFARQPALLEAMRAAMGAPAAAGIAVPCDLGGGPPRPLRILLAPQSPTRLLTVVMEDRNADGAPPLATVQEMMDAVGIALALVEAHTNAHRIIDCNAAFRDLLGVTERATTGRPLRELAQDRALSRALRRAADDGTTEILDDIVLYGAHAGRPSPPLVVQITPYPVAGTAPRHLLLSLRERAREAGIAVRHGPEAGSLNRQRVPGMLYRRRDDAAWTVELSDGQVAAVLGTDGRSPAAMPLALLELVHPDDRNHARAAVTQALQANTHFEVEYRLRQRNGRYRYVRDRGAPVRDVNGEAVGAEGLIEDITTLKRLTRRLERGLRTDPLTGALNFTELGRRIERLAGSDGPLDVVHTLLYVDLDRFRVMNEVADTEAGSAYLRQLVRLLRSQVRRQDHVARIGGDRFAVLLERCSAARARVIAEAMRAAIENHALRWGERTFRLTASLGLYTFGCVGLQAATVLAAADQACNTAKELGRNRVFEYDAASTPLLRHRKAMRTVAEIDAALNDDRFVLYAQPIVSLSGETSGDACEILLRMREAGGGLVGPAQFLPVAESFGLTGKIDRWVLRNALGGLVRSTILDGLASCAINVSAHSIDDASFTEFLVQLLTDLDFPAHKLCLEITETAMIHDLDQARAFMAVLRALGCRFALDDFGSGMASFGYLKHLPVDLIKIDGQFVRNIAHDNFDLEVVKAATILARASAKLTVAEHVENAETLWLLRKLGVDYGQGYHLGHPMPLSRLVAGM